MANKNKNYKTTTKIRTLLMQGKIFKKGMMTEEMLFYNTETKTLHALPGRMVYVRSILNSYIPRT